MKKMRDHFDEFSGTFENAPAFVIDIGSNDGSLLESFRRRGSRVLGVDAARDIAREATRNGIPTVGEMLDCRVAEKIVSEHGKAELVTAFNVFAHNDDLSGMLDAIKILMKPEGRFCFEAQYLGDILDKALFATLFHEHLSHHSVGSLFKFFKKHGMTLVDVKRNDIQHGSIIGTAVLGKGEISENVTDLIWEEGWINKETVWRFGRKVSDIRNRITYKGWGYGAAHSGPTLIDLLNLKIDKIVDDHPQKVGKWAGEIEVLPTKELLRGMPEYCFILAWVHNDRIIENAREYMKRGGKMVVLCPDFRVINHG
jgi:SAM-dependent methyltransferase